MTLPKRSLSPTGSDDRRAVLGALELVARGDVELVERFGTEVGERMALEPGPQVLHRIQIGRIRGQELDLDMTIDRVQVFAYQPAVMSTRAVPEDEQRYLQVRFERLEKLHDLLLFDAALVQSEQIVQAGQARDDRDVIPVEVELDDRGLAPLRPGAHPGGPFADAGLVDEDDQAAFALGFFLSRGQVRRFQWRTASSSRSMARRSGFWELKPSAPSIRQIWVWPNLTPYMRVTSTPTRLSVHNSVPKPCAVGDCSKARRRPARCSSSSRPGRPRPSTARRASIPPSSNSAFHVYTVCRATPTACAACAGVLPANSMRPARKRRRTDSSNRFVTMPRTQYPSIGTTHDCLNGCHDLGKD